MSSINKGNAGMLELGDDLLESVSGGVTALSGIQKMRFHCESFSPKRANCMQNCNSCIHCVSGGCELDKVPTMQISKVSLVDE